MSVKMRQLVERGIAQQVIEDLLAAGYLLGVNNGEETTIHHSRDAKKIEAAMFTTDEDWLYTCDAPKGKVKSWVRFIYGNDGWDVVSDYTVNLESIIGAGTATDKLIEKYSD